MADLIGAAGCEIDAIESRYMQGAEALDIQVSEVRRRIDLRTWGVVRRFRTLRFSVLCRCSASIDLKGAMFLRRIFVHPVHAH
jgi:hypothetical protein